MYSLKHFGGSIDVKGKEDRPAQTKKSTNAKQILITCWGLLDSHGPVLNFLFRFLILGLSPFGGL